MTDLDLGLCDVCRKRIDRPEHVQPSLNPHVHTWCRISSMIAVDHAMAKYRRERKK